MDFKSQSFKAIIVSGLGGGLEIYDFTIYAFFAVLMGKLFFPHQSEWAGLLNTFLIFAMGYFSRPFGAIIFGHIGDKWGRKNSLLITIALMAFATASIGFLPTYNSLGLYAPLLLVLLRFLQGIAVGGDLPGAITFVSEHVPYQSRGLACGWIYFGVNMGMLLASMVGFVLTLALNEQQLMQWGWRLAFIIGLGVGFVGLYLRNKNNETPWFLSMSKEKKSEQLPLYQLFSKYYRQLFLGISLILLPAVVVVQLFIYMPTYLEMSVHLNKSFVLFLNSFNILIFALAVPFVGHLADKIGKKYILIIASLLLIILSHELYQWLNTGYLILQFFSVSAFSLIASGVVGVVPGMLPELFPTQIRYTGVAFSYSIGYALFAGTIPIIAIYLLHHLNTSAIGYTLVVAAVITLFVSSFIKENQYIPLASFPVQDS